MKSTTGMAVKEYPHNAHNIKRKYPENEEIMRLEANKKNYQKPKVCEIYETNEEVVKKSNICEEFRENTIEYSNIIFESAMLPFENQIVTVENEVIELSEINNQWCPMTVELLDLDKNQTQVQITETPKNTGRNKNFLCSKTHLEMKKKPIE
jgi:hypothetical protein